MLDSPPEDAFDRLTRVAASALGVPVSLVSLVEDDRQFFKSRHGLPEPWRERGETPLSHSFCQHVVVSQEPLVIADARLDPVLRENLAIRDLGVIAYAGYPVTAPDGQVLGSFCAIDGAPREWSARDLDVLRDLAAAASTEIALRVAALDAQELARRFERLQSITDAALAHLSLDELLAEVLERVARALEADTAVVLLREGDDLVARASRGLGQDLRDRLRVPVGEGFAGRIARDGAPLAIDDVAQVDFVSPMLRAGRVRSLLGVPLRAAGEVIGVLHVGMLIPRTFSADDQMLLELAADRVARGIGHARVYERERELAATLQRSILPARIPQLPGLSIAARYLPAAAAAQVGGDWYDVFALADGGAVMSVGDVAGHGVGAAAVMGRLRSTLHAYAIDCEDPVTAVERVDALVSASPEGAMATLGIVAIDARRRTARLAAAGHVPALLVAPDGTAALADGGTGIPLGVDPRPRPPAATVALAPGTAIVLYTDGLVERRREPLDAGLARLAELASGPPPAPGELCDRIVAGMLGDHAPGDDVAVLVARIEDPAAG